ncbi:hypothetical protein IMZ31_19545 (plasmid) [Pontibacillus sp. ALD_SL1]|uniref:hypothetical protein n=1 Tax=Pontibacillus sp. ALD_SL1 TaxID=2777185 RepID=UPI001A972202|nr:hypothetical protein [Pontibacillus sp. ALD_SL1]QST02746.1 hypothetical protein IMZ31_19545 [Pontibacillus sp. ALD_SL1]
MEKGRREELEDAIHTFVKKYPDHHCSSIDTSRIDDETMMVIEDVYTIYLISFSAEGTRRSAYTLRRILDGITIRQRERMNTEGQRDSEYTKER